MRRVAIQNNLLAKIWNLKINVNIYFYSFYNIYELIKKKYILYKLHALSNYKSKNKIVLEIFGVFSFW
jgi:hypothetical protein